MTQGWGWGGYLKADNERVASKTTSTTGRGGGGACVRARRLITELQTIRLVQLESNISIDSSGQCVRLNQQVWSECPCWSLLLQEVLGRGRKAFRPPRK